MSLYSATERVPEPGSAPREMRVDYKRASLSESDVHPDPITQFGVWFEEAVAHGLREPNAMTLATVGPDGRPSARIVLLKGYDPRGFVFFTNYESRKGRELSANPHAALVFFWADLERQIRIEGMVERVDPAESDDYFKSRPLGSRLGALASRQSTVIPNRDVLDRRLAELEAQVRAGDVPQRPDWWGGYRVTPSELEFWQGRSNRLHDRLRYCRDESSPSGWRIERLSP